MLTAIGRRIFWGAVAEVTSAALAGAATTGAVASVFAPGVGQSSADERAAIQQASQERAARNGGVDPQLGQARGADEERSQSDTARERARTNGGLADVHGNSHETEKQAQGYSLRDKDTGEILKYGETTRGTARYSKEYLDKYNARIQFEATGTKAQMHKWQHDKILEYKKQNDGARPPLNKNDY